jgi:hypothetical protein
MMILKLFKEYEEGLIVCVQLWKKKDWLAEKRADRK